MEDQTLQEVAKANLPPPSPEESPRDEAPASSPPEFPSTARSPLDSYPLPDRECPITPCQSPDANASKSAQFAHPPGEARSGNSAWSNSAEAPAPEHLSDEAICRWISEGTSPADWPKGEPSLLEPQGANAGGASSPMGPAGISRESPNATSGQPEHEANGEAHSAWWAEALPHSAGMGPSTHSPILWLVMIAILCGASLMLAWTWTRLPVYERLLAEAARPFRIFAPSGLAEPSPEPTDPNPGEETSYDTPPPDQASGLPGVPLHPQWPTPLPWTKRVQRAAEILRLPEKLPETLEEFTREAFLVCEQLIEDLPERPEPLALAARLYDRHGNTTEAEKLWRKALELDPDFAPAHSGLGWLAARREALHEATEHLRRAVALDPGAGFSHGLLVDVLLRQERPDEALSAAQTYVKHFPRAGDSHFWLGQALLQLGRFEEAKKAYLAAVEYAPDYAAAYQRLSLVCLRLGEKDQAEKWQEKFLEQKQKDSGSEKEGSRQHDQSASYRQLAAEYHLAAGNVHTNFGDVRKAEAYWIRGVAIAPHAPECRLALALFYEQERRLPEALEQWEEIVRLPQVHPVQWFRKGQLEKRLGLFAAAENSYRQAAALAPYSAEPYEALVDLFLQHGHRLEDATALAEKAVELAPTPHNYFALSAVRESIGDLAGALRALEEALRHEPGNPLLQVAYQEMRKRYAESKSKP